MNGKTRRKSIATMATAGALLLVFALPTAVSAAELDGTKNCPGKYGWMVSTTFGYTEILPPGSWHYYVRASGGSHQVVALQTNYNPQIGGGYWWVEAGFSISVANPECRTYG